MCFGKGAARAARVLAALVCALAIDAAMAGDCEPRVAILVYHRFSSTADDSMTVRTSTLEAQLRFLRAHGYQVVPLRDVVNWAATASAAALPGKSVALTVDDGHRSVYEVLRPIVLRERLPVTLFIYPSAISNANYALTWNQLRALRQTGLFDIQSHTYWHPNFHTERKQRNPSDFHRFAQIQLDRSKMRLEAELGTHVDMLAWPFGIYDRDLLTLAAQSGYVAGFTLDAQPVTKSSNPLALPRFLMVDAYGPTALGRLLGETQSQACPQPDGSDGTR
jgi:peptidoglycan/xylan/chitin deacetylase (PgdA/CDA1 family)